MRKIAVFLLVCLLPCFASALTSLELAQQRMEQILRAPRNRLQAVIVVDAGSTGSRLHLYHIGWPAQGLPSVIELFSGKVHPGIAEFAAQPELAASRLLSLIERVRDELSHQHMEPSLTPVFIGGTGGMRHLDEATQNRIYSALRAAFISRRFYYTDFGTLDGEEEAVFSWIAVNYLARNFSGNDNHTMGMLELGGASTQIAFSNEALAAGWSFTDDAAHRTERHVDAVTLGGKEYPLFLYSFQGLGLNDALAQLSSLDQASCYPTGMTLSTGQVAHFDYDRCKAAVDQLLQTEKVKERVQPYLDHAQRYELLSGFYYAFHFFGLPTNLSQLAQAGRSLCSSQDWAALQQAHRGDRYLAQHCFGSVFVPELLGPAVGYGFALDTQKLQAGLTLRDRPLNWPLGAAVAVAASLD